MLVGDAWAIAKSYRPDLKLYLSDGSHPSQMGTYLTVAIFVKTITGNLPKQMPGPMSITDEFEESVVLMFMQAQDAAFFKKVAKEIVDANK